MELKDNWNGWKVVLASGSPRRKELLAQIGIDPQIIPSRLEEHTEEKRPEAAVMELSRQKAEEVAMGCTPGTLVIGADTVVAAGGEILGKPGTPMRAYEMVEMLQGSTHQVYTGVTLLLCMEEGRRHGVTFAEKTEVSVYPMEEEELRRYAESGEPLDKAGGYGIQGSFAAYIKGIIGDYSNVVGLPLGRLYQELKVLLSETQED